MKKVLLTAALAVSMLVPATAMASTPLGGLDLNTYCVSQGYDGVVLLGGEVVGQNTFNNWRCYTGSTTRPFAVEQACQWQYGTNAVRAVVGDRDNAFSIVCYAA